jgi:putative tryptophan/tyrosine transport system substrate-binding protein
MRWTGLAIVLAVSLTLTPLALEAQPAARVPLVGIVSPPPHAPDLLLDAFRRGLSELGYLEGQNVRLEVRQWDGGSGQSSGLIAELIRLPVDVLVVATTGEAIAAKRVTSTIPIVAASAGALVESGAVASLSRPGGNVTGLTALQPDLSRKRLDLLKEALPSLSRIAVLMSPYRAVPSIGERMLRETEAAAAALRLQAQIIRIEGAADLEGSFQAATLNRANARGYSSESILGRQRRATSTAS